MDDPVYISVAVGIFLLIIYLSFRSNRKDSEKTVIKLQEAKEARRDQPATLHPEIDPELCAGCAACVTACPEGDILGLVYGRAHLVDAAACVGHGACKDACPFDAISLVLGTKKRGVQIPELTPDYQSNVPGLYVVGELSGMGLIRNAVKQGKRAIEYLVKEKNFVNNNGQNGHIHDLIVIGAGPAGLSAALEAKKRGYEPLILEQDAEAGGAISHYPRKKLVMATDVDLPIYGKIKARQMIKSELKSILLEAVDKGELNIQCNTRVNAMILQQDTTFRLETTQGELFCQKLVLAIGRRGTPRTMGIPGEECSKVYYSLLEPEHFRGDHCMVIGGGDSALEAAYSLAEVEGTTVTLVYRSDKLWRAKKANIEKVHKKVDAGKLRLVLSASPTEVRDDCVMVQQGDECFEIQNTAMFIMIGGKLPIPFLEEAGIALRTVYGERISFGT